jgi:hypothetical protein
MKDLTAPRYKVMPSGIQIEDKTEVKKRIGKSPDKAEALMYALYNGGITMDANQALAMLQGTI